MKTRELLPKDVTYYKANLHCHTVFSDGKMTPEEVKKHYQEKGYQVLPSRITITTAITDRFVMRILLRLRRWRRIWTRRET